MTSPGGKEVGRISIRVVPGTNLFRPDLKEYLEKLERTLKIEVPVRLNAKKAIAQAAALKSSLGDLNDVDIPLTRTETAIGNTVVAVINVNKRIRRTAALTARAAKSAVNLKAHWQGLGGIVRRVGAAANQVRMDGLFRTVIRSSDAVLNLDKRVSDFARSTGSRLGAVFARLRGGSDGAAESLRKAGKRAQSAGRKFLGLTRVMWIVVAVFTLAAPAVALIGSLLAGLPFLLAAVGAAAGAIALGMDGIKDAAEQLKPAVQSLREELSETFRVELTPLFERLIPVMEALGEQLSGVAFGLSKMAKGFVDAVTSARGMDQIDTILNGIRDLFIALEPFVRNFMDAFLTLAAAGAREFGTLAGMLNTFAADFAAMADRISSNGSFATAMTGLAEVLGSLLNLFIRLMEVGVAAMGQLGGPLATFVTGFGDAIIALMPALTVLSATLATLLGETLTALAPAFEQFAISFSHLATQASAVLLPAITALAPLLTALLTFIAENIDWIGPLIFGLLGIKTAVTAWTVAQRILNAVMRANPLLLILSTAIIVATLIIQHWDAIKSFFVDLWNSVWSTTVSAWNIIWGFLSGILGSILSGIGDFVNGVIVFFITLPDRARAALGHLGNVLWYAGIALIQGFIDGIWAQIGAVAAAASGVLSAARAYFPFSPAKVGPFSGKGYTLWSGKQLVLDWAKGIESATPKALDAIERMMGTSNQAATAQWEGHIGADDFGSVADRVGEALSGWSVQLDENGLAKLVRSGNRRRRRRA